MKYITCSICSEQKEMHEFSKGSKRCKLCISKMFKVMRVEETRSRVSYKSEMEKHPRISETCNVIKELTALNVRGLITEELEELRDLEFEQRKLFYLTKHGNLYKDDI